MNKPEDVVTQLRRLEASKVKVIRWVGALKREVGLPKGLAAAGVKDVQPLLDLAMKDPCHSLNPRAVTRLDVEALYRRSL